MIDTRELILSRLFAIFAGMPSVDEAYRNNFDLPDDEHDLRRVVMLDGDEDANEGDPDQRPPEAPRRVIMHPEIFLISVKDSEDVGSEINSFRANAISAVLYDSQLKNLTIDDVGIRYMGLVSGLSLALRGIEAAMALNFSFTYVLNPADLQP